MIGDKVEELPEDLRITAKRISDSGGCSCDISVGHICEPCLLHSLMFNAAREIEQLKKQLQEKRKTDKDYIATLPIADFTGAAYVGKNLYTIARHPGLYCLRSSRDNNVPIVKARRRSTRGASWAESVFVRNYEVEKRLKLAQI